MKANSASATARTIAAAVVLASHDRSLAPLVPPDSALWSERFLLHAPSGPLLLRSLRLSLGRLLWKTVERVAQPGIMQHWLARKLWIEARVRAALNEGATRLVIIAAGLDTLGVRLALEYPSIKVIEIDHPATQRIKQQSLGEQAPIRLLPCDLACGPLPLDAIGDGSPTVVVLEGVLMYLDDGSVRALLRRLLDLRASRLWMVASFMMASSEHSIGFEPHRPMVDWWLSMVREPFRSALQPRETDAFFASIASEQHVWQRTAHADADTLRSLARGAFIARGEEVFECERVLRVRP